MKSLSQPPLEATAKGLHLFVAVTLATGIPVGAVFASELPTGTSTESSMATAIEEPPSVLSLQQQETMSKGTGEGVKVLLSQFVRNAFRHDPALLQAESESRGAEYRKDQANGAFLPQLFLSTNAAQERQSSDIGGKTSFKPMMGQVRMVVPLFDPAIYAQLAQRNSASIGADWHLTDVREQLMLRTVVTYIELARETRLVLLAQNNLKIHRQYVSQVKSIANYNLGRAADIASTVARTALAEAVLMTRLAKLESVRSVWRQTTGISAPGEFLELPMVRLPQSLDDVLSVALTEHPVLMLAQAEIAVAKDGVALARAAYRPKLNGEIRVRSGRDWGGYSGQKSDSYIGVSVEWNFFSGMADRHASKAAVEGVIAAQHAEDRIRNELRTRIEQTWYELQAADASLRAFGDYAQNAQIMVEDGKKQFKIGRKTLLEVLNAENELFTARSNIETAQQDIALASWRLHSLQGRLQAELEL